MARLNFILALLFFSCAVQAQTVPQNFTIEGRLFDSGGAALNTSADIILEVLVQGDVNQCVFYRDTYTNIDLSSTDPNTEGVFALRLGASGASYLSPTATTFTQVFSRTQMSGDNNRDNATDAACTNVNIASGTPRLVRVSVRSPTGVGGYTTLSPDTILTSTPTALVADSLRGYAPSDFINVRNDNSTFFLGQGNLETVFNSTNWPKLQSLLAGTSGDYMDSVPTSSVSFNSQRLINVANPTGNTDAANKQYVDGNIAGLGASITGVGLGTGGGSTLVWDQVDNRWEVGTPVISDATKLPLAGGTMTGAISLGANAAGTAGNFAIYNVSQIYNVGHITMAPQNYLNVGTFTTLQEAALAGADRGKIWYNTTVNELRYFDGTVPRTVLSQISAGNGVLATTSGSSVAISLNTGTGANQIVQLGTDARLPAVDGSLVSNLNAVRLQSRNVAAAAPIGGQVLMWNNALAQWEPTTPNAFTDTGMTQLTGDVVANGSGSVAATISQNAITSGKINNVGIAVNRLLITDNSTGASLTYATCAPDEILKFNASTGWSCAIIPAQLVTSVAGKTGAVTLGWADVPNLGTAALYNVGTAINNVVQLSAANTLPALDGHQLTNLNAVRIQSRVVSSASPTDGQVLRWNNSLTQWEPSVIPSAPVTSVNSKTGAVTIELADIAGAGDITEVNTGVGILGGATAGAVNLSVNVGTGANQIVQMGSDGLLPVSDGSKLTNLNAIRLQGRSVAASAPADLQVLQWNATAAQWTPAAIPSAPVASVNGKTGVVTIELSDIAGAGDITQVVNGAGATGGGTAGVVTIGVDVGTGPNQVVQLNGTSQLPAVNGSLLTNVNAMTLQTYPIASTPPTATHVLTWNGTAWLGQAIPSAPVTSVNSKTGAVTIELADIAGAGDITAVNTGVGILGGSTSGVVNLSVNVGTGADQIVQMGSDGLLPVSDGSKLTNLNAIRIQGRSISATPPAADQVLRWNGSLSIWEPQSLAVSAITALTGDVVASGVGSVAATISNNAISSAKINNAGIAVNRLLITDTSTGGSVTYASCAQDEILKFNSSTGWGCTTISSSLPTTLPALDGYQLTNLNAVRLQTRNVSSVAPSNGEALTWNNTLAEWRPTNLTSMGLFLPLTGGTLTGPLTVSAGGAQITGATSISGGLTIQSGALNMNNNNLIAVGSNISSFSSLTIQPNSGNANLTLNSMGTGAVLLGGQNGNSMRVLNPVASPVNYLTAQGSSTTNPVTLGTNGSDGNINLAIMPKGTGFVGIGTNMPTEQLMVKSNSDTTISIVSPVTQPSRLRFEEDGGFRSNISFDPFDLRLIIDVDGVTGFTLDNQGRTTLNGTPTNASAALDVRGTTVDNSSIIVPRASTTARPTTPVNGMIRYNTTTQKFEAFEGVWQNILGGGGSSGISNVVAGAGLLGGGTSAAVTLSVAFPMISSVGGTSTAPAYSFTDSDNGMFSPGVNQLAFSTTGSQRMLIDANGRIGIGTGTLNSPLNVFDSRTATTGGPYYAAQFYQGISNTSSAGTASYSASLSHAEKLSTQDVGTVIGATNKGEGTGSGGSLANLYGAFNQGLQSSGLVGSVYGAFNQANTVSGNLTNAYGAYNSADRAAGAQTTATAYGSYNKVSNATGTTTTAYGVYSEVLQSSGTITTAYGMYVGTVQATNRWSIYANDANAPSYFAGKVAVGTTTPTLGAILDLNGTGANNSSLIVPRDTTALRPTTGVNGMIRYNTTTQKFEVFEGVWQNMISSGGGSGPWTVNAPDIYFTSGDVGIGNSTPTYMLHVGSSAGPTQVAQFEGPVSIRNNSTGEPTNLILANLNGFDSGTSLELQGNTSGAPQAAAKISGRQVSGFGSFIISTASSNTYVERMTVDSSGNVGIGVTPTTRLDVGGPIRIGSTAAACNASSEGQQRYNSTSKFMEYCNGTTWIAYAGTGGGNVSSVLIGNMNTPAGVPAAQTYFFTFGANGLQTTEATRRIPIPRAGIIKNFYITTNSPQPAGGALVATIRVNGVNTPIAFNVPAGAAAGTFFNTGNNFAVNQGDLISISLQNTDAGSPSAQLISATLELAN